MAGGADERAVGERSRSLRPAAPEKSSALGELLLPPPAVSPPWGDVPKVATGITAGDLGLTASQASIQEQSWQQWNEARRNLRREPASLLTRDIALSARAPTATATFWEMLGDEDTNASQHT